MAAKISRWVVLALIAALYAYLVAVAVVNVPGMLSQAEYIGLSLSPLAWVMLIARMVLPLVVGVIALLLARGRAPWSKVLILVAGLCVVAAWQLALSDLETRVLPLQSFFA